MKNYRKALPAGIYNLDHAITICFDETCSRELIDRNGAPIDVSSLSVDVQNCIADWQDAFEDGLNQFDGQYEYWAQHDGSMLRRRAWKVEDDAVEQ